MRKSYIFKFCYFFLTLVFIYPTLIFGQLDEIQITTHESQQSNAVIWDSILVYQDGRLSTPFNFKDQIYSYNLSSQSETVIKSFPYDQTLPDVWNNRIVWNERGNIYMFDLIADEDKAICEVSGVQGNAKIEGDYIVWQDERNSNNPDIYMYNLTNDSTIRITDDTNIRQEKPDVSGNTIIWLQENNIYVHDLVEETTFPINPSGDAREPAIFGRKIVWQSLTDGHDQIFMYDLDTEQEVQITSGDYNHSYPAISSSGIVWEDFRNSPDAYTNSDLFLYDFATESEIPICTEEHEQQNPAIWQNRVVWHDTRNGNRDIYMAEFEQITGSDLEISMTDDPDPVEQGYYVNFTIDVLNKGPETATNVEVDVLLPGNLEFVSIAASQGDCSEFSSSGICNLGNLAKGESAIITLIVTANGVDDVNTTASASSDLDDPNLDNNSVTENTIVSLLPRKYVSHGWMPNIVLDAMDSPHLGFTYQWPEGLLHYGSTVEGVGGADIKHAYYLDGAWNREIIYDGRTYSDKILVPTPVLYKVAINSDITVDLDDTTHIVYSAEEGNYIAGNPLDNLTYYLYYRREKGEGWSSSRELIKYKAIDDQVHSTNAQGAPLGVWSPNIVTDNDGKVHITFMDCEGVASPATIHYITNASGQWVNTTLGAAYDFLDMVIDDSDYLHLSFYNLSQDGIYYLTNSPSGQWQSPELVEQGWSGVQMEGMCTGIAVDQQNHPHIVYAGQTENNNLEDIKYAYKENNQWNIETVQEGLNQSAHNSIAVDENSNVHLCYFSRKQERLIYAVKSDESWTKTILDDVGQFWNDITVTAEGTAHICFDNDLTREDGKIYYVSNRVGVDGDFDGISDHREQGPDGNDPAYDGDGNGIPDYQQKNAASFQTSDDQFYVTLVCDTSLILSDVSSSNNPSPNDAPEGFDFPFGSFSFTILGLNPGDSTTVQLILPEGTVLNNYFKYGATLDSTFAHWYEFMYDGATGAEINGNIITLHLIDGQRGDDDIMVNGSIYEPGVPATIATAIEEKNELLPAKFDLAQNYPNPFNNQTRISYSIADAGKVELIIYNVLGQQVKKLINEAKLPGKYNIIWDGKNQAGEVTASGLYFYRLKAGDFTKVKKMLLVR